MEKPARKRGRPPITKEYSNPLESPMAHSSIKVQKLGAQSFSRPMMKVGQTTPSPRKRRRSSSYGVSCHNDSSRSATGSTAKRGRYRGVLLTTPTKKTSTNRSATASSTPSSTDSIFQSSSKMSLKSSPPVPIWSSHEEKGASDAFQQFKFALTIGENGRATIAGSSPNTSPGKAEVEHKVSEVSQSQKAQSGISATEKNRVLSLLRQMRNTTATTGKNKSSDASNTFECVKKTARETNEKANMVDSPSTMLKSPQPPSTPRVSFAVKTGFTPNAGLDQVLLDIVSTPKAGLFSGGDSNLTGLGQSTNIITFSPKNRTPIRGSSLLQHQRPRIGGQNEEQRDKQEAQRQQYVFKFLSADPLLLTDDAEASWSEMNYSQSQPSHQQVCFNTPPSWVNWGSPRAFTPQRQDSTGLSICQSRRVGSTAKERSTRQTSQEAEEPPPSIGHQGSVPMIKKPTPAGNDTLPAIPTTPRSKGIPISAMIECTPLIQQTMNGSLTARFVPGLLTGEATTDTIKDSIKLATTSPEQEDARAALQKLIAEK
ncbi:hypothetical protein HG536_0H02570 [Torulaspora globosa]|uniref:Uncharacterized protein n=1 Tax=Torulaspora globosa TaxID=48254 RepID=A0A7G3ZMZ6_9SACH|nr:uncharacterized protein HG536_0H02570 [Torulaspora globosa]QLL34882.1 hypothetical protein HG536_0H02570 [Torulaspora globosa]